MPRRRRYFESGGLYELSIRSKSGLPFPPRTFVTLLIKSALARTQRDSKVKLCHMLWMGNHAHFLVICRDAFELTRFYGELQKRLTDYLKRLLGLRTLDLWKGAPAVIRIADLEAAKDRISYFYANPANAGLVDSIDEYPGFSSYQAFMTASHETSAKSVEDVAWIRCPDVPLIPKKSPPESRDDFIVRTLCANRPLEERLELFPNSWMECFDVTEASQIQEINQSVLVRLREREDTALKERSKRGIKALGRLKLLKAWLDLTYIPKKFGRRIFVIANDPKIRKSFIEKIKRICEVCAECFQKWLKLDFSENWPIGTFPPPRRPLANVLA